MYVLRSKEDIDDFITFATKPAATVPATYDTTGSVNPFDGLIHGAGAGKDGDSPDHYIGTIQGKDSRGRAKARRGKRVDGRG